MSKGHQIADTRDKGERQPSDRTRVCFFLVKVQTWKSALLSDFEEFQQAN
jgi:hypothetical protein